MKINLHKSPHPFVVGDLVLFESKRVDSNQQDAMAGWIIDQKWFKSIVQARGMVKAFVNPSENGGSAEAELCWLVLQNQYDEIRKQGEQPDWLRYLPLEAVRRLEHLWIIGDGPDQYKIVPRMTYAGIGYVVYTGGIVERIDDIFGLHRLNGVAQLGFLHDPTVSENGWRQYPQSFPQTRYVHSLDVHALATIIGARLNLPEEKLQVLRVAAQSHDALTPAGGDSIKAIDRDAFDEDTHYQELFKCPGWNEFRDELGLSEAELVQIILGKGILGSILDISDKLAYVGRDLEKFLMQNPPGQSAWENFGNLYNRITGILVRNQYPCSVWECVDMFRGELIFTDQERLADFLCMRALMFRILYNNASARFYEAGFAEEVVRDLYKRKVLTRDALLRMTDNELTNVIGHELEIEYYYRGVDYVDVENSSVIEFATKRHALAFERGVAAHEPDTMTHYELIATPSASCLESFKVMSDGCAVPFRQACPAHAWDIQQMSQDNKPHKVFSYNLRTLCNNAKLRQRLLDARNTRIAN